MRGFLRRHEHAAQQHQVLFAVEVVALPQARCVVEDEATKRLLVFRSQLGTVRPRTFHDLVELLSRERPVPVCVTL